MFLLKWPAFPNPFWFSAKVRGDAVEGEVISENTVKSHIQHMLEKTGYGNRTELAIEARVSGIVIAMEE